MLDQTKPNLLNRAIMLLLCYVPLKTWVTYKWQRNFCVDLFQHKKKGILKTLP